jgi:hypothetical protein
MLLMVKQNIKIFKIATDYFAFGNTDDSRVKTPDMPLKRCAL